MLVKTAVDPKTGIAEWKWQDDAIDTTDQKFRVCIVNQIIKNVDSGYKPDADDFMALLKTVREIFVDTKYSFDNIKAEYEAKMKKG